MEILKNKLKKSYLAKALLIYNYFIENTYSNFEEKKLSLNSFLSLKKEIQGNKLPFILAKKNEKIIGLAFVNKFRNKSGYKYTYEHSIYVDPDMVNKGYGSKILKELILNCKKNKKIKNLIAVIGGSNNLSSIKIHKKNGFKLIGTIKKAGYKKNKWIDSVYMQKIL
tara:strand:+ start:60 stop:560 length:501 start_codon:yes stop_codon:yes gene_type:complete